MTLAYFQIGKQGINLGVIEALDNALKNHNRLKISVLKASGRNRDNIDGMANEILNKIKWECDYKIIGFTIVFVRKGEKQDK